MEFSEIILLFGKNAKPSNREGMERFAITADNVYGTGVPFVRGLAKQIRKETKDSDGRNALARKLWAHGAHETKLLASMVAVASIGWNTVEDWVDDCQNWAEVDQLCSNLLGGMEGAPEKALEFSRSAGLWRKRAGFALMAVITMRGKDAMDGRIVDRFLAAIERESTDERNFVKKAVNWALRHVGKTGTKRQYGKALALARKLAASGDRTARWIGSDALRELERKGPPARKAGSLH